MSEGPIDRHARGANFHEGGTIAPLGAGDWLSLAAAPAFAVMALLTSFTGSNMHSAPHDASMLSGMVPMYAMMCVVHSAPWLKLISGRRSGGGRPLSCARNEP